MIATDGQKTKIIEKIDNVLFAVEPLAFFPLASCKEVIHFKISIFVILLIGT
jgi:hypothetical protein